MPDQRENKAIELSIVVAEVFGAAVRDPGKKIQNKLTTAFCSHYHKLE